jgi:hypothetical protein
MARVHVSFRALRLSPLNIIITIRHIHSHSFADVSVLLKKSAQFDSCNLSKIFTPTTLRRCKSSCHVIFECERERHTQLQVTATNWLTLCVGRVHKFVVALGPEVS